MERQALKDNCASHSPSLSLLTFVQEDYVIDGGRLRINYGD